MTAARLLLALSPLASSAAAQLSVGPAVRVDQGGSAPANETSVSVSPANPLEWLVAWNDFRVGNTRLGTSLSLDGGATWSESIIRPPAPNQSVDEGDPMTAWDPLTGDLYVGGVAFGPSGGVFVARKDAGAPIFGPSVMAHLSAASDKGWMAAGPDPLNPSSSKLYVAFNQGLLISADRGSSWSAPAPLGIGIGFKPRVGPNGELYVAFWTGGAPYLLWRSFDGGQTLLPPVPIVQRMDVWSTGEDRIPGDFRIPPLPSLAVCPVSGDLYFAYCDTTDLQGGQTNLDVYLTRSSDQGASWSLPSIVNNDTTPSGDQVFPWIEVDAEGRVHLLWLDTRFHTQLDDDPFALLDAVYAYSDDAGATFSETRLTAQSFSSADDGFGGVFLGDYLGMSTAFGRTLPAYPTTAGGDPDVHVHELRHGPATGFCLGLGCPCGNDDPHAGCGVRGFDNDPATGALLSATGSATIVSDDLVLSLEGLGPAQFGLLYTSLGTTTVPFGSGLRCLAQPFYRYPVRQADSAGRLTLGPNEVIAISQSVFAPLGQVSSGSSWHYQAWFRDPGAPCASTFGFSNGLTVVWQ